MAKRKKKASSNRKVSRRALLKGAGAAVAAVTASLFIPGVPRMVHSEVVRVAPCPTWDRLLNHISRQTTGLQASDRRPELDRWVHGLVMRPHEPQPALLLLGPQCSGKRTFHHAMGSLLPDQAVVACGPTPMRPRSSWIAIRRCCITRAVCPWSRSRPTMPCCHY